MSACKKHNLERNKWGHCPQCKKEYWASAEGKVSQKKYNNSEKGKIANRRHCKKYSSTENAKILKRQRDGQWIKQQEKTPEIKQKLRCRRFVNRAIRDGRLVKQPCVICNDKKTDAHHAWGYSEEHRLHVVFLCRKHHSLADRDMRFNEIIKSKNK